MKKRREPRGRRLMERLHQKLLKLVIGLIPVCRQLTQFFELGLWQFDNDVKPNIRVTRPGKVASGVNVSGGHIQGAKLFDVGAYDS